MIKSAKEFFGDKPGTVVQSATSTSFSVPSKEERKSIFDRIKQSVTTNIDEARTKTAESIEAQSRGEQGAVRTGLQVAGNAFGAVSGMVGDAFMGGLKAVTPDPIEQAAVDTFKQGAEAFMGTKTGQELGNLLKAGSQKARELKEKDPALYRDLQSALQVAEFAADWFGGKLAKEGAEVAVKTGKEAAESAITTGKDAAAAVAEKLPSMETISTKAQGVIEGAKDVAEKVGRGVGKVDEAITKKADEAAELATLPKTEQTVRKMGVPREFTAFVKTSDKPALETYKQMIDAAEVKEGTVQFTKLPRDIAGEVFINQYKAVDNARKAVGKQIGERVAQLSKTVTRDISGALARLEEALGSTGVTIKQTKKGPVLNFSGTRFTTKQRKVIEDLYKKSHEAGTMLTPKQIYEKDRLFSALQREAGADDVADLLYTKADGTFGNLYQDARDIFSNELDELDEGIRELNKKYRPLAQIRDQVEGDVLNIKDVISDDAALSEFADSAGIALQRVMGNSQGGTRIKRLAELVEQEAQKLGYNGPSSLNSIKFARQLEDLFDITPETGLQGRVESAIGNAMSTTKGNVIERAIDTAIELGAPSKVEKREALKAMIEELLASGAAGG